MNKMAVRKHLTNYELTEVRDEDGIPMPKN